MPDGKTWENEYLLINTDVYISWQDYFNYKGYMVLKATYKNKVIFEKHKISNIQIVIDTLNRFNNISLNELEKLQHKKVHKNRAKPFGSALFLRIYHIQKNFSFSKRAD